MISPYFTKLLEKEDITFDSVFTDNFSLAKEGRIQLLDQHLKTFFDHHKSQEIWLFILDQLSLNEVLPFAKRNFKTYCIIDVWSGIASLGKKLSPENIYLDQVGVEKYHFPFDERGFLKILKEKDSSIIMLTDQEIPENIYKSSTEEQLQIVDKALVEQPQFLSLLDPENPDLFLVGTGSQLEELVKLSQLLALHKENIALGVCWTLEVLSIPALQQKFQKVKKIWIIIDHKPTSFFQSIIPNKEVSFLSPNYQHITSISAEWSYAQTGFDAESLFRRSLALLT